MIEKRFFGWKKGPDIIPEFKYEAPRRLKPLPSVVDLEPACPPVYDQDQLGSCTSQAVSALAQFIMKEKGLGNWTPSRLAIYWYTRLKIKIVDLDHGASLYDSLKTLIDFGVPHESLWPYDIKNFRTKPTKPVWSDAYWHTIDIQYAVDQSVRAIKNRLYDGYPVVFGFNVFESFETASKTGTLAMPGQSEAIHFGHAVMAVGYDDRIKCIKVRNSWGPKWANKGYFWMPYDFIDNPNYCSDFWTAHDYKRFKD